MFPALRWSAHCQFSRCLLVKLAPGRPAGEYRHDWPPKTAWCGPKALTAAVAVPAALLVRVGWPVALGARQARRPVRRVSGRRAQPVVARQALAALALVLAGVTGRQLAGRNGVAVAVGAPGGWGGRR